MKTLGKCNAYDTKALSEILGVSQAFVRKLGKSGKISYSFSGSKMMFDRDSVKKYLEG